MRRHHSAYTPIELLATISIISLLSLVAIPTFDHSNRARNADSAISQLQHSLNLARQTAITRGENTVVCPSANGQRCDGGGDWSRGGIAFVDLNKSGQYEPDEEKNQLIERIYGIKAQNQMVSNGNLVEFNAFGLLANGNLQTIEYCDMGKNKNYGRKLTLNLQGRIKLAKQTECSL